MIEEPFPGEEKIRELWLRMDCGGGSKESWKLEFIIQMYRQQAKYYDSPEVLSVLFGAVVGKLASGFRNEEQAFKFINSLERLIYQREEKLNAFLEGEESSSWSSD